MLRKIVYPVILCGLLGLSSSAVAAAPNGVQDLMIYVKSAPIPWGDVEIESNLIRVLSRNSNLIVQSVTTGTNTWPQFPDDYYNLDSITNWGMEWGGRYLLIVDVKRETLVRRKNFHLPLVFHKYQTIGIIEAEIRLLDIERKRLVLAEPLIVEQKGPRVFQGTMDDDINDPDLHLTAPGKLMFFRQLEKKFCDNLIERMARIIRIRKR